MPRLPSHVVVLFSASTAGYAALLAGVTGLQATHEAALIADRAPASAGLIALTNGHDELARRLDAARSDYTEAAAAYDRASATLDAVDRQLAGLAATVAQIDGVSRSLPSSVRVPIQRTVTRVKAPATNATTGASGG